MSDLVMKNSNFNYFNSG